MSGELIRKCGECGYWDRTYDERGQCHYWPPAAGKGFPQTFDNEGCGKGMTAIFNAAWNKKTDTD